MEKLADQLPFTFPRLLFWCVGSWLWRKWQHNHLSVQFFWQGVQGLASRYLPFFFPIWPSAIIFVLLRWLRSVGSLLTMYGTLVAKATGELDWGQPGWQTFLNFPSQGLRNPLHRRRLQAGRRQSEEKAEKWYRDFLSPLWRHCYDEPDLTNISLEFQQFGIARTIEVFLGGQYFSCCKLFCLWLVIRLASRKPFKMF